MTDSINAAVMQDIALRAERGFAKYGVTLDRTDLSRKDWLCNLYEELLDAACYTKRLIMDMEDE